MSSTEHWNKLLEERKLNIHHRWLLRINNEKWLKKCNCFSWWQTDKHFIFLSRHFFPSPHSRQKNKTLPLVLREEIPDSHFYSRTAWQGTGQESPCQQIKYTLEGRSKVAHMAQLTRFQTGQLFPFYSFLQELGLIHLQQPVSHPFLEFNRYCGLSQ